MEDYNHYAGFGVLGEILPDERNNVTLAEEKDQYGERRTIFNLFENDRRLISAGVERAIEVHEAAGATRPLRQPLRAPHGSCRLGFTPEDSVVDRWCRGWDVPNSSFPTAASCRHRVHPIRL